MATPHLHTAMQCSTSFLPDMEQLKPCSGRRSALLSFPTAAQRCSPRSCHASFRGPVGSDRFCHTRSVAGCSGRQRMDVKRRARFQQFSPADDPEFLETLPDLVESEDSEDDNSEEGEAKDERDDRVLPTSLEGTILQASESAALYVTSGGDRALVEMLMPQLQNSGEEGDQKRLWDLSRIFLEDLKARLPTQQMKVVFPDAGVAAMIKHQWKDSPFLFASLNDKKPITIDDEVVVLIQPDYQMLPAVEKIASLLRDAADGPPRPLIMYNPALQSGEVGIGLNVRRMREFFLGSFNSAYSMRAMEYGAVFRRYPGPWKVFFGDEQVPGRYVLASESPTCPPLEDIEMLYLRRGKTGDDDEEAEKEPGPLENVLGVFSSMSRFMRSLSQ